VSGPFTRVGKEILANGYHYADAADETAGQFILDRLTAQGWQPIETAPRDYTRILVFSNRGVFAVEFDPSWGADGWWLCVDGKHDEYPLRGNAPTHWMPLPSPPVEGR